MCFSVLPSSRVPLQLKRARGCNGNCTQCCHQATAPACCVQLLRVSQSGQPYGSGHLGAVCIDTPHSCQWPFMLASVVLCVCLCAVQTVRQSTVTALKGSRCATALQEVQAAVWAVTCWSFSVTDGTRSSYRHTGTKMQLLQLLPSVTQQWYTYLEAHLTDSL